MNDDADIAKLFKAIQNAHKESESIPIIELSQYNKFINENSSKLVLLIIGNSGDFMLKLVLNIVSDIIKDNPNSTAACILYYDKNEKIIEKFNVKNQFEYVFIENGKEVKRFTCNESEQMKSYFLENKPKNLFSGQGRSLANSGKQSNIDTEAYFKSKRIKSPVANENEAKVAKQKKIPNLNGFTEKQKEILLELIDYDFLETDEIVQAIKETKSENEDEIVYYVEKIQNPNLNAVPENVFYDEELYNDLSFLGEYTDEEIKESFKAGNTTLGQCEKYIIEMRKTKQEDAKKENIKKLTKEQILLYKSFLVFPNIKPSDLKRAIIECDSNKTEDILKYINRIKSGELPPTTDEYDNISVELTNEDNLKQPVLPKQPIPEPANSLPTDKNQSMSMATQKALERKKIISRIKNERNSESAIKPVCHTEPIKKQNVSTDVFLKVIIPKKNPLNITLDVNKTFEDLRIMLIDNGAIDANDNILFRHPLRGSQSDFSQTFKEKMITGKQALYVDILSSNL